MRYVYFEICLGTRHYISLFKNAHQKLARARARVQGEPANTSSSTDGSDSSSSGDSSDGSDSSSGRLQSRGIVVPAPAPASLAELRAARLERERVERARARRLLEKVDPGWSFADAIGHAEREVQRDAALQSGQGRCSDSAHCNLRRKRNQYNESFLR